MARFAASSSPDNPYATRIMQAAMTPFRGVTPTQPIPGIASQHFSTVFGNQDPYKINAFLSANRPTSGHHFEWDPKIQQFNLAPNRGGGFGGYLQSAGAPFLSPLSHNTDLLAKATTAAAIGGTAYGALGAAGAFGGGAPAAGGAGAGYAAPYSTTGALQGGIAGGSALGAGVTVPGDIAAGGGASGFLGSGGAAYLGAGTGAYAPGAAAGGGILGQLFGQGGWQNAAILGGTNLLGAGLQANAINKANQANQNAIQKRIRDALNQLSPEQIKALTQQFLPDIMSIQNPLLQSQLAQFREAAGQRGLGTAPITGAQETALRASGVNAATTQAFERAMGLAGARASAITGAPIYQQQPNLAYGNVAGDTLNQLLLARYLQQPQGSTALPYLLPNAQRAY